MKEVFSWAVILAVVVFFQYREFRKHDIDPMDKTTFYGDDSANMD